MRKVAVLLLVCGVAAAPLAFASPDEAQVSCPGYFVWEGVGPVCPTPDGLYEVLGRDGRSLGTISHVDPVTDRPDPPTLLSTDGASDVQCVSSTESYAIWVIYARASNDADQYASRVPTIRNLVAGAQQKVSDAAQATGGTSKLKVRCDANGDVVVSNEVLPTSTSNDDFSTIIADLDDKGYDDPKKKYWVYYDASMGNIAGTGHFYSDTSDSVNNYNNGNHPQAFFAVSFDSNSVRTMLHELSHTIGAVQPGAPANSGTVNTPSGPVPAGHCIDGLDFLCYDDGGSNTGSCVDFECSGTCAVEVYDCNKNTYYNLNPATSAWLYNHWNIGETYVRYINNVLNIAPTMTALVCSPTTGVLGDTVSCDFTATDNSAGIAYNVNWGDGTTERVPATGYVASGTTRTSSRTYQSDGQFTVSVTATDDDPSPLTSAALTRSISIQAAPTMTLLSCAPSPSEPGATVTCSVRASDNSSGVYYTIDWNDGSPTQRVPATGTVAPGVTRTATHSWSAAGTYTISAFATDNGAPALSSGTLTTPLAINPNAAPAMTSVSCTPDPVQAENPTTCSFSASDQSGAVYYQLDWGDGTTQRVPASGTVAPGTTQTAGHTYLAAGTFSLKVNASDLASPPLTGADLSTDVDVTPANVAPLMQSITCDAVGAGAVTHCDVLATDADSTGLKYNLEWGDGTTSIYPTTGLATPGVVLDAPHTYARAGSYLLNVTATDNGSPAKTSLVMQKTVLVSADGVAPSLVVHAPQLHKLYNGCGIVTEILAGDPVFLTRGCVMASAADASGVANVTVRINGNVVATDTSAPYTLDFVVPHGLVDATLAITAYDVYGNARTGTMRVDTI